MSTPVVEEGQFDDAPDDMHPEGVQQGHGYIDETPLEQTEDSSEGDSDVYSESEDSDDDLTRVEDEDWEIAERGARFESFAAVFIF